MPLPPLNPAGDLPPGVHHATVSDVLARFGAPSARRRLIGLRLQKILSLLNSTGHVARLLVFGSFVSDKEEPNDLDLFLVMEDSFDLSTVSGAARLVFDHAGAQSHFGASIFWVRRLACFPTEAEMVEGWGIKRDGTTRGIIEIERDTP